MTKSNVFYSIMVSQSTQLVHFLIFLVLTSLFTGSSSNRFIKTQINVTSSDPQRLKIIGFDIDQNAVVNVTYQLMQPWNNVMVKNGTFLNFYKNNWNVSIFVTVELFSIGHTCWKCKDKKNLFCWKTWLLFERWKPELNKKSFCEKHIPGTARRERKFIEKMPFHGYHITAKLTGIKEFHQQCDAAWKIFN